MSQDLDARFLAAHQAVCDRAGAWRGLLPWDLARAANEVRVAGLLLVCLGLYGAMADSLILRLLFPVLLLSVLLYAVAMPPRQRRLTELSERWRAAAERGTPQSLPPPPSLQARLNELFWGSLFLGCAAYDLLASEVTAGTVGTLMLAWAFPGAVYFESCRPPPPPPPAAQRRPAVSLEPLAQAAPLRLRDCRT